MARFGIMLSKLGAGISALVAPDAFVAMFSTTAGDIRINVTRSLAPVGVDQFYSLLQSGYYDDNGFVRIEKWSQGYNFVQWGIASDPMVAQNMSGTIPDDTPCWAAGKAASGSCFGNVLGSFALAADAATPNSRSTMVYVNMQDNSFLDAQSGFVPFGVVADTASWATLYNLTDTWLETIYLPMVYGGGSEWLRAQYPGLSYTVTGSVEGAALEYRTPVAAAATPAVARSGSSNSFAYNVSWLGNSYGGGPDQFEAKNASWVSYCADDVDVDALGYVFSNTGWDEGTREAGIFAPNGTVAGLMADLHGWNRAGGVAVAAGPVDSNRVYVGMSQAPLSYPGPLRDYPAYDTWYGVRTYDRDGNTVPCPAGTCHGWDSSILVVCSNCSQVGGIATSPDGSLLYVSDTFNGAIKVYNLTTYNLSFSWPVARPGKLTVEHYTGNLWVAPWTNVTDLIWPYNGAIPADNTITRYTASGELLPEVVNDVVLPTDVAVDGAAGMLIVTENGPDQQVIMYVLPSNSHAAPAASVPLNRTMVVGVPGGVLAGSSPGQVAPDAFAYITGVGFSGDNGALVVASVGYTQNKMCSGLDLRKLGAKPSLAEAAAAHRAAIQAGTAWHVLTADVYMNWNLLGLEWVDSGHAAPVWPGLPDGVDVVYTEHERFVVNYNIPVVQQWSYVGYTVDPTRFATSDARLQPGNFPTPSLLVRNVQQRTHLFASGMYVQGPAWYRLERESSAGLVDSEIAIPCGLFSKDHGSNGTWPATQGAPVGSSFVWQDLDGNGLMTPSEFTSFGDMNLGGVWGNWVDDNGGLWITSEDHFTWMWQPLPLTPAGCLIYNFSAPPRVNTSDLAPLAQTERTLYLADQDVLYVTGFTPELNNPNRTWGQAGRWIQRYDSFLATGGVGIPGAAWMLPWTNHSCPGVCSVDDSKAVSVIDDLVLVVTGESATVYVYNGTNADVLGTMTVAAGGPAMGNYTGWVDTPFGLTVARTARGTVPGMYSVFVEEDGREKVVLYTFTL